MLSKCVFDASPSLSPGVSSSSPSPQHKMFSSPNLSLLYKNLKFERFGRKGLLTY